MEPSEKTISSTDLVVWFKLGTFCVMIRDSLTNNLYGCVFVSNVF